MGNSGGRVALGRGAFGELIVFRDLRQKARELGHLEVDPYDIALIDIHLKRMKLIALSNDELLEGLETPQFRRAFFRGDLFDAARARHGELSDDECFAFVPALTFGGSEDAASARKHRWMTHQALLLQS